MNNLRFLNITPNNNINTNLVSKNIDNYFNNLLKNSNITDIKKTKTSSFYNDYIEHNILLIFIILSVMIFLFIRYYNKEDHDEEEDERQLYLNQRKNLKKYRPKKFKKIKKIKKMNYDSESNYTLDDARRELDNEKNKILKIIDELSTMNQDNTSQIIEMNNSKIPMQKKNLISPSNDRKQFYEIDDYLDNDPINNFKDEDSALSFRSNDPINNMYMNRNHQFYEVDNKININSNISSGNNFVPKLAQNNFKEIAKNSIENISDDIQLENPYY